MSAALTLLLRVKLAVLTPAGRAKGVQQRAA